jgi:hypothetical protein
MVKGRVRNVAWGRGAPTARPEHMSALKESHLARPADALLQYFGPAPRLSHTIIMSRTGPTSSARALDAILPLISAGQPYEAHQKARTFATRYTKSGAHPVAIDVLFQSARELLKAGHAGSGTDLAILLLDSYDSASEPVNDVSRGVFVASHSGQAQRPSPYLRSGRVTQLIALAGPSGAWRKNIIDKSIMFVP